MVDKPRIGVYKHIFSRHCRFRYIGTPGRVKDFAEKHFVAPATPTRVEPLLNWSLACMEVSGLAMFWRMRKLLKLPYHSWIYSTFYVIVLVLFIMLIYVNYSYCNIHMICSSSLWFDHRRHRCDIIYVWQCCHMLLSSIYLLGHILLIKLKSKIYLCAKIKACQTRNNVKRSGGAVV